MKELNFISVLCLFFSLVSCESNSLAASLQPAEKDFHDVDLKITCEEKYVLKGECVALRSNIPSKYLSWQCSSDDVCVDENGVVYGIGLGSVVVTASFGTKTASVTLVVAESLETLGTRIDFSGGLTTFGVYPQDNASSDVVAIASCVNEEIPEGGYVLALDGHWYKMRVIDGKDEFYMVKPLRWKCFEEDSKILCDDMDIPFGIPANDFESLEFASIAFTKFQSDSARMRFHSAVALK